MIIEALLTHPKRWLTKKHFKRVLVAYVLSCSEDNLQYLHSLLSQYLSSYDYLKNRHNCLILLAFLERGLIDAEKTVFHCIKSRSYNLLRWSVFIYFLEYLAKKPTLLQVRTKINTKLKHLNSTAMRYILQSIPAFSNYNLALSLTM